MGIDIEEENNISKIKEKNDRLSAVLNIVIPVAIIVAPFIIIGGIPVGF